MITTDLKGLGVALVTPFDKEGNIDFVNLKQLVQHTINQGVDYLVALGTTAETPTLTHDEAKEVLRVIVETNNNRLPIMLGLGGTSTKEVVDKLTSWDLTGVSAILSVTPYYNRPSQEGLYEHYKTIAYHSPLPIMLYTVRSRTACNLEPETTLRLAELNNIIGIKEASGNMNQIMKLIKHKPKDFLVISGDDAITLPLLCVGIDGLISVVANAFPKECAEMVHLAMKGKFEEARTYHNQLLDITQACFKEGSPAGVKALLAIQNMIDYNLRLPLTRISVEHQQYMKQLYLNFKGF